LKVHEETRQQQVYLLVKGGKRLKLDPPKDANAYPWVGDIQGGEKSGSITPM
jgi:hypothetical protein